MVYLLIDDIIFLVTILIILIIIYRRIIHNWDFIENIKQKYFQLERKARIKNRIKYINRQPVDKQKIIFEDISILIIATFIILIISTKSIFFAAVVSDSMTPTFNKNDLILIQNIDRKYNVGDIIMFERPDTSLPVSHRIISITDDGTDGIVIRTAGDATKGTDWWKLKNDDIKGKAIVIQGKPIMIKEYGKYFIVENKNQRFGPFDYQNYYLFISVVKAYGYAIAIFSLLIYIVLTLKGNRDNIDRYKF